ncbi:response regulator [Leptolyngbya sp. AN10]|uniref:response regulator n=1 Tax=Leptolyngbya sp. AN10 TaxID=3423365 RepID=UPI003D31E727
MKILLIEDNPSLAEQLIDALKQHRYTIDLAVDGLQGWDYVRSSTYDLVLMDVMLPKLDGVTLCRQMRASGNQTPILMLTALKASVDQILGLDSGADDYLIKPIGTHELTARIRALLRRGGAKSAPILTWGKLQLDPNQCEVKYGDRILQVSPKEYAILELMLRNGQRVYKRSEIIERVWSCEDDVPNEDTVKAHIKGLRRKLREVNAEDLIQTVYGLGYRLNLEYCSTMPSQSPASPSSQLTQSQADLVLEKLIHLAHRFQHPLCIALLEVNLKSRDYSLRAVIQQIGEQLQHQLNIEDVVADLGEGQFVVGIYGTTRQTAVTRLNHILTTLDREGIKAISTSLGVAQYPNDGQDLRSLYRSALMSLKQNRA